MFENPNMIPRILRRQESQENYAISRPLFRSKSCPMRSVLLEDETCIRYFESSSFETFFESRLTHIVQDPIFIENLQLEVVASYIDKHLQNSIQLELIFERTPSLAMITTPSSSSPSAPQTSQPQATLSTPPICYPYSHHRPYCTSCRIYPYYHGK